VTLSSRFSGIRTSLLFIGGRDARPTNKISLDDIL
jgi:hypothetical protein